MAAFEYRQAEEIRDAFRQNGVWYLFLGKSGAILLGFPDTTQDADVFVDKSPEELSRGHSGLAASGLYAVVRTSGADRGGKGFRADRERSLEFKVSSFPTFSFLLIASFDVPPFKRG